MPEPAAVEDPPEASVRDFAWAGVAALGAVLILLQVVGIGWALFVERRWSSVLTAPLALLAAFWWTAGAWRRTFWSRRRRAADGGLAPWAPEHR